MGQYFGTDGIRGRWGSEKINPERITQIAQAIGSWLHKHSEQGDVLIAGDTRQSTAEIMTILGKVLNDQGVNIQSLGMLPSPGLAYMTRTHPQSLLGIMVTASHNPASDNGIKLFGPDGCKLPSAQEQVLDQLVGKGQELTGVEVVPGITTHVEANAYLAFLQAYSSFIPFRTIVLDAANGAASYFAKQVFANHTGRIIEIASNPDGENINLECGATAPEAAREAVLANQADIGIVLDGDADRIVLIDHEGQVIDGDAILYLFAKYHQPKGVVGTLMTNYGLEQILQSMGIGFERTAVGDKYIIERLKQLDWPYGAESSGHVISLALNPTGDGLLTALLIMQMAQKQQCSIKDLLEGYHPYPQTLINIKIDQSPDAVMQQKEMVELIDKTNESLRNQGRLLIRPSGTEPLIRVMVEAKLDSIAQRTAQRVSEAVREML